MSVMSVWAGWIHSKSKPVQFSPYWPLSLTERASNMLQGLGSYKEIRLTGYRNVVNVTFFETPCVGSKAILDHHICLEGDVRILKDKW